MKIISTTLVKAIFKHNQLKFERENLKQTTFESNNYNPHLLYMIFFGMERAWAGWLQLTQEGKQALFVSRTLMGGLAFAYYGKNRGNYKWRTT